MRKSVINGECQLVYITPESLLSKKWRSMLLSPVYEENLKSVVFDEAHCIDKWYVEICITITMTN
jgi:superfamily II DNA helicase RecQ